MGRRLKAWFNLRNFVTVSLLLFLGVSYQNTKLLADNFHREGWPWVPWAFAGAVELGVIGLAIARIVRQRQGLPTRWFTATLAGVLTLSVVANFLSGVASFYPALDILGRIRQGAAWWVLPLLFAAVVPVLVFAFSELLATLEMERREQAEGAPRLTEIELMVLRQYGENPALQLKEVAQALKLSMPSAYRLLQAMKEKGLLTQPRRGVYLPAVKVGKDARD